MSNITALHWVPEPDGRGTFGIVRSCVITLALCVYTAVHVNIPRANASAWEKLRTKAAFVGVGIFAPELVIFVAWVQRRRATRLSQELDDVFKELESKDPSNARRRHKWTLKHSFYAAMGGFAVDTADPSQDSYIPKSPRLALYPKGVEGVARLGILPDISTEYISDKSKADSLAKTLVIAQASWLIIQCIMRWVSRLPVTPLELNTLAHGVCALVVYFLWWEKPVDVQDPTLVTAEPVHLYAAYAWASTYLQTRRYTELHDMVWLKRRDLRLLIGPDCPGSTVDYAVKEMHLLIEGHTSQRALYQQKHRPDDQEIALLREIGFEPTVSVLVSRHLLAQAECSNQSQIAESEPYFPRSDTFDDDVAAIGTARTWRRTSFAQQLYFEDEVNRKRYMMVFQFRKYVEGVHHQHEFGISNGKRPWRSITTLGRSTPVRVVELSTEGDPETWYADWQKLIDLTISNLPFYFLEDMNDVDTSSALVIFCFSALAYGGIHASAWTEIFPSRTEEMLWQISCGFMVGFGVLVTIGAFVVRLQDKAGHDSQSQDRFVGAYQHCYRTLKHIKEWLIYRKRTMTLAVERLGWRWLSRCWSLVPDLIRWMTKCLGWLFLGIFCLLVVIYCIVRIFFVVEAFVSLRSMPQSVYETPSWSWTQYLAHL